MVLKVACPFLFVVFGTPVDVVLEASATRNGAYVAGKYPGPGPVGVLSATKVGNTWLGVRSLSFSMAMTLPIFGAMSPKAAAGFLPICCQVCASEWTSAQALIERTRARSPSEFPSLGSKPAG